MNLAPSDAAAQREHAMLDAEFFPDAIDTWDVYQHLEPKGAVRR
jgi:hypothetical protein